MRVYIVHVLLECSAYSSIKVIAFGIWICKLDRLNNMDKTAYICSLEMSFENVIVVNYSA